MDETYFNHSRLHLARRRRGMSRVALGRSINVSPLTIRSFETLTRIPKESTIQALAGVLKFPVEFFYGPALDEPLKTGVSFRALSSLTAAKRDQALAGGALAFAFSDWISQRFRIPLPDVPSYPELRPEDAAMVIRAEWGLGEQPIRNMIHLLEWHGVRVFSVTDSSYLDAYSTSRSVDDIGNIHYVFLNTTKSSERVRMDAAHELGHLVLHSKGGAHGVVAEKDASTFASAFLMPRSSIMAGIPRNAMLDELLTLKSRWTVSLVALVYRLNELGMLSDWYARQLFISIGQRGYRTHEPRSAPYERSNVLTKVIDHLRTRGVTMSEVAKELLIPYEELTAMVSGLVPLMLVSSAGDQVMSSLWILSVPHRAILKTRTIEGWRQL